MARALNEGVYAAGKAQPTLSPSMDIQVASNFERALFEASCRNTAWLNEAMDEFAATKKIVLPDGVRTVLRARYAARRCNDEQTLATIARVHAETGRLIDPHTAVGVAAAYNLGEHPKAPIIVLSTAHPAKFPDAVRAATGRIPPAPPRLSAVLSAPEKIVDLAADKAMDRAFIEARLPSL